MRKSGPFLVCLLILAGCSGPVQRRSADQPEAVGNGNQEYSSTALDGASAGGDVVESEDIRAALKKAEAYYTKGVIYYQRNILDSSQVSFEEALLIISDLDFDESIYRAESKWMATLLKEIESDYRLTLMTSGVLYSEGSAAAFRELFSDIKNFKTLKDSGHFHDPTKDSVTYDVPIVFNDKVENSLAYLQTVAHETFETYLSRSGKYIPHMEKILAEEGLPHDLVYLPLIESGFNPHAYSYARAVGPWQFISATGKRYGLNRDWWHDERRDFEKSTRAAARYLKDLYEEFDSWELALAAYNGGEGRVRREIRRAKSRDFWKLKLARQTRNYIPLFMAATIIAKQPHKYGFFPDYAEPLAWEAVDVSKCISFKNISEATSIPVADLELLNPSLVRGVTPPNAKHHTLRVPVGYGDKLRTAYDDIPSEKNTNWVRHQIKRGETVSTIARRYGVSLSSLISANDLHRPYKIYVGQTLIIPVTGGQYLSTHVNNIVPDGSGVYIVKRGDTLWEIARAHGVTLGSLKRINRLSSNRIYPGRKLIIPGTASEPVVAGGKYVVRRGDTLSKIARQFGMTVAELKSLNGLRSDRIFPNMKLNINKNSSSMTLSQTPNKLTTYKVKRGDSLWKIARLFNVTVQDLIHWNQIGNPSKLNRGEVLKIYVR